MRRINQSGRHAVARVMAAEIIRLNRKLRIVGVRGKTARAFNIYFPVSIGRVVTPGKQAKDDVCIQVVHARTKFEPIAAVTERPRGNNFGTLPLI